MTLAALRSELEHVGIDRFTSSDYRPGRTTHIVLFKYRSEVSADQRDEVVRRFHSLAATEREGKTYIVSIESGVDCGGEDGAVNYDHGFVVTFQSLGDRNFYVGSPVFSDEAHFDLVHAEFKEFVFPLLADGVGALVFDFQNSQSDIVSGLGRVFDSA